MSERREPPAQRGTHPPIATNARLSPMQEAWSAYVDHALHCPTCRSRDTGQCDDAEELHRAYQGQAGAAFRKLGDSR